MSPHICSMRLKLFGLPQPVRKKFNRALAISGQGSQAKWLLTSINRFIRQSELKYGDLNYALTAEEEWIVEVVTSGAAEPDHISEETGFALAAVMRLLADLVDRGVLETRKQGGKTDQARGARRDLYFISEKYVVRTE